MVNDTFFFLGTAKIRFERKVDAMEAVSQYHGRDLDKKSLKIELCRFSTTGK